MNSLFKIIFIITLIHTKTYAENTEEHKLQPGDVISISTFNEPDLSFSSIKINENGYFSFPFAKDIDARGKTVGDIEKYLTEKITGSYLKNPIISVTLLSYNDIYVGGDIINPGKYPYEPQITVYKLISLAGGTSKLGFKERAYITRETNEKSITFIANIDEKLEPGDIVRIKKSLL